jgi:uncharacterized BrkB/YihY/UPF0761 family membrane protein
MKKIMYVLTTFSILVGFAMTLLFLYASFLAYLNNGTVTFRFNDFNENIFETFLLLPAVLLITAITFIFTYNSLEKENEASQPTTEDSNSSKHDKNETYKKSA